MSTTTSRPRQRRNYTTESLQRALVRHGATFTAPEGDRSYWLLQTGAGTLVANHAQVQAYVAGLADMRDRLVREARAVVREAHAQA
jgi:hypothetical protein